MNRETVVAGEGFTFGPLCGRARRCMKFSGSALSHHGSHSRRNLVREKEGVDRLGPVWYRRGQLILIVMLGRGKVCDKVGNVGAGIVAEEEFGRGVVGRFVDSSRVTWLLDEREKGD